MTDFGIREMYADLAAPDVPSPAFVRPPSLARCRVAVVTSAALRADGEGRWLPDGSGFRLLATEDVARAVITHHSSNFDRVGFASDPNVVVPVDRLSDLAREGRIGSVAPRHVAFLGAQREAGLTSILMDSGPAAAQELRADDVDVAVLTPVCPACTRTLCIVAHALEKGGVATVVLASIRGQAVRARPPRALAVDFPLGRPLGRPADPSFQHRVLAAALDLLERREGPVLEDFPDAVHATHEPVACTIPLEHDGDAHPAVRELRALRPAHERRVRATGRTGVGRAVRLDGLEAVVDALIRIADGVPLRDAGLPGDHPRDAALDLRAFYEEAALALVDHVPEARATDAWFATTAAGRLLGVVQRRLVDEGHARDVWLHLLPMDHASSPVITEDRDRRA